MSSFFRLAQRALWFLLVALVTLSLSGWDRWVGAGERLVAEAPESETLGEEGSLEREDSIGCGSRLAELPHERRALDDTRRITPKATAQLRDEGHRGSIFRPPRLG